MQQLLNCHKSWSTNPSQFNEFLTLIVLFSSERQLLVLLVSPNVGLWLHLSRSAIELVPAASNTEYDIRTDCILAL
jgi:hypothetical protein